MAIDLGPARELGAEAFGQPGQRTFQLRFIGASGESATVGVEKQHLVGLSVALEQILEQLGFETSKGSAAAAIGGFPSSPDHEYLAGRMSLGLEERDNAIILVVYDMADTDERSPTLSVRFTPGQADGLRLRLNEIISAGRPICQLCGAPIDPQGHACIRSNGHSKQPIPDAGSDS